MRRLVAGLVVAALLVPGVARAQSPTMDFITQVVSGSAVGTSLQAMGEDPLDQSRRDDFRAALARDKAAMAGVVPDACLLPAFMIYVEVLTLGEVALDLLEDLELTASTTVMGMMNDRIRSLDADALAACM